MGFEKPLPEKIWRNLKGYCISCGFLGKRSVYLDKVFGANDFDRTNFAFTTYHHPTASHRNCIPHCFINQLPLSKEFRELEAKYQRAKDNSEISHEITTRDVNCPKWIPYTDFLTPKEHLEDFTEEVNRRERKRTNRIMIGLTIALIVFAIVQAYTTIATINPERWLFEWLR